MQIIELDEERAAKIPECYLEDGWVLDLYRRYSKQVQVEFPSIKNERNYILRPRGYVGNIWLGDRLIDIRAKVGIYNIYGMLEFAYKLNFIEQTSRLVDCRTIEEIYERLAERLARLVIAQMRKGVRFDYEEVKQETSHVRGRLLLNRIYNNGTYWQIQCRYPVYTSDILDNRILSWTLYGLNRLQFQNQDVKSKIRRAYKDMAIVAEPLEVDFSICWPTEYNRLNESYRPIHALCRFFLEQCGPALGRGDRSVIPIVINMPLLFERFVAEWLSEHLPDNIKLNQQHRAHLEGDEEMAFQIDMVLLNRKTEKPLAVLDTKYTQSSLPREEDIHQVVAYAVRMDVKKAFLVHPSHSAKSTSIKVGEIEVHSVVFDINRNLLEAGNIFLRNLKDISDGVI